LKDYYSQRSSKPKSKQTTPWQGKSICNRTATNSIIIVPSSQTRRLSEYLRRRRRGEPVVEMIRLITLIDLRRGDSEEYHL
jgi:hypothetical protein